MKFLCVLCDEPMKLVQVAPPDRGSLSVVYECPHCAHRIAMLTNPLETQMVTSLGVVIGPSGEKTESKCPFSEMIEGKSAPPADGELPWTAKALERLANVPAFVRPMARAGIERYARDQGVREVDEQVLDRAKSFFGM
ncbi:MAG TPA: PCP reductase family protein [Candidatus Binatia bacterium]|nr:PCP reductase family protein [Candidatus Binatia bacterium]